MIEGVGVSYDELALLHLNAVATGSVDDARASIHPANVNHMAADEPPACARPGVAGLLATSAWLRLAFSDLRFEPIQVLTEGATTIAHVWMRACQTGPFVVFPPGMKPVAFPPTGRSFAVRQCHVFEIRDDLCAEHIAVRDDLGMMTQLGHLPPGPAAMARMARWNLSGGARKAVAAAVSVSEAAARTVSPQLSSPQ